MNHYNKIVDILEKPYIRNLVSIGVTEDHYNEIFSIIFKGKIKVEIIDEDYFIYDESGRTLYNEISNGVWELRKFDNHLLRYYENSYGRIFTYEYGIVVKN
jgi:hypothetical protein